MISKNEVKYIQSLHNKKERLATGLFLVEGSKLVAEVLQSAFVVQKVYATDQWLQQYESLNVPVCSITDDELHKISTLRTPNQVLALVQMPTQEEPDYCNKTTLVIDGIQNPGNLGTIIRIADWFGIGQMVCSTDTVECYNPKVIQSTMGSFLRVRVTYTHLEEWLQACRCPVVGTLLQGRNLYSEADTLAAMPSLQIVIGNEGQGIRANILPYITHPITIPRFGEAESLNAAIATGIVVSHICKNK